MILSALQSSRKQKKGTGITLNFYEDRISFSFTAFKIVIFYSVFRHWSLIEVIPTASKLYTDTCFYCKFNASCIKELYKKV